MKSLEKFKVDYLKKLHQFFVFDKEGVIQDTCNSLSNLSDDIGVTTIYDAFPFIQSFQFEIDTMETGNNMSHECIGMKYKELQGTYDIFIKRFSDNEYCLVLEDRTEKNEYWQNIQQERNEITMHKEIIEHQAKVIEYKNKKITDSINYAKRIQNAVLPNPIFFQDLLPQSFIVYKPKDIISGDFYWAGKSNGKAVFTAADSTGHGVPGALLSMIGASLLNQAVLTKNITKPSEILNGIRNGLLSALKQNSEGNKNFDGPFDGMDLALCSLNDKNHLEYSGAHNPLVIIRNSVHTQLKAYNSTVEKEITHYPLIKTKTHNLFVIKGERQSIGRQFREKRPFTNHSMQLEKEDRVYLFSDGIQDQFGQLTDTKFSRKRFWNLLLEIQKEPIKTQGKVIEKAISNWQGSVEQTDDICLVGIQIS